MKVQVELMDAMDADGSTVHIAWSPETKLVIKIFRDVKEYKSAEKLFNLLGKFNIVPL